MLNWISENKLFAAVIAIVVVVGVWMLASRNKPAVKKTHVPAIERVITV
jgi:hypothetical protein